MRSKLVVITCVLAMIALACGSDTATTTSVVPDTGTTSRPEAVGQDVGPEGGTVISEDGIFSVEIPPGALSETTSIAVKPIPATTLGLDGDLFAGPVYELLPDGLSFDLPVVTIRTVSATALGITDDVVPFFHVFQGLDEEWEALSTNTSRDEDTLSIRAETTHFSPNVAIESTWVWGQEIRAALTPGSFAKSVGSDQDTAWSAAEAVDLDLDAGHVGYELSQSGAIVRHAAVVDGRGRAECGDSPGDGTYAVRLNGAVGFDDPASLFVSVFGGFGIQAIPEPFTVTATGKATCIEVDLSIGESLVGAGTGTLSFQPFEGGPPGVAYNAELDVLVLTDEGVFTVEKTQKPSNQKTEGALDPTSGGYFTIGGKPDVNFEAYVGVMCPLPDGAYWLYGFTFGGSPSLQDELDDILDSLFILTIDIHIPGSIDGGAAHDLGLTRECDLDVDEAIDRALKLMRENAQPESYDFGWFHRYAGRVERSR